MIHDLTDNEMTGTLALLVRSNPAIFARLTALELFELFYDINLRGFVTALEIDGFLDKVTDYWQTYQAPVLTPIYLHHASQNSKV